MYWIYDAGFGGTNIYPYPDTTDSWPNLDVVRDVYQDRSNSLGRCFKIFADGKEVETIRPSK